MITRFLMLLIVVSQSLNAQHDSIAVSLFSLTPRTNKTIIVDGIALGAGINMAQNNSITKVNGLNLEINPFSIFLYLYDDSSRRGFSESATVAVNGLSIGTGHSNQNESIAYSGVMVSFFNVGHSCSGISFNVTHNYVTRLDGLHLSMLYNYSKESNGMMIGLISNYSETMNGVQVGVFNQAGSFKGVQIGLVNKSKKQKGLQIGFWNSNNKRSMPFINW
ncbi:hypothetical protein OX284_007545 [Flavobacterium sp. SUN046]|uniref:LA_2272 family surface repeat-containing protein n=1 Tax=Flavobacterium sp. SUN046 TaxID=3002440 RepID=UPI002DBBEBD1|nr:hypothetical protein [Flavobacterium sp. SUN046]MEC4049280.1 hypothetical protein [Flavobacterium sp. SUN046]